MPKDVRKRGKKHKKIAADDHPNLNEVLQKPSEASGKDPEAPFGLVDPDLKAYFRTVDTQIQDWNTSERYSAQQDSEQNESESLLE